MKEWKSYYRRGMSLLLVAAMLATGNVSEVSAAAASYQQKAKAQEAGLREAIRDGKQMVQEYPNGLFNFLGTQMEVKESDKALEIAVIRQGGTEGSAQVKFKAIDITSSYGEDYKIYVGKNRFRAMKKGKDAFPLIQTAMEKKVDLSKDDTAESTEAPDGSSVVEAAAADYAGGQEKKAVATGNPLDQYPDVTVAPYTAKADSKPQTAKTSLKARRDAQTGQKSDRPNWKIADNSEKADEVRDNFEVFMDNVSGSEQVLNFKDGEYVKYLYLVPKDDKISEAEEQLVCALLPVEGSAPVGESYNAYVNIKDNDGSEASKYTFAKDKVNASADKAVVTVRRTAGINFFDSVYIGTGEGSANQGADYKAGLKKVDFYAGETEKKVSIDVLSNEYRKASRDFYVLLSRDGSSYMKDTCQVVIPAATSKKKAALKTATAAQTGPEKISPNGWKPANGQWAVPAQDMDYSGGNIWRENNETRFQYWGGDRWITTKDSVKLYGASAAEFGYYNSGNGRQWTTTSGWWIFKKTHHHSEKEYGVNMYFGNDQKWNYKADTNWAVCKKSFDNNNQWKNKVKVQSWAKEGNHTNGYVGWMRLYLKKYTASCQASQDKFYTQQYQVGYDRNGKGELTLKKKTDITPTLKIDSVSSNVQNSKNGINQEKYDSVYRSDVIRFKLEKFNEQVLELNGIQASTDNRNWQKITDGSNLNVVLNADFFSKFNLYKADTIYFRPVLSQKTAKLKLENANVNRGMLKGFDAKGKEFTLKVGDTVKGLTGSGNVAAYNPAFSVYTTRNENDYKWGRKSFAAAAAGTCLTLDNSNSAGNVANISLQMPYNIVKLDYSDTKLQVEADPNSYRDTYTNLKYVIAGKTYNCSKASDVEAMQTAMEKLYQSGTDAQVSISFEYLANPKYKNGKGDQAQMFGKPVSASLCVYDDSGALVTGAPYKLTPTVVNGKYRFSMSGTWKKLGWVDGTGATITISGSRKVNGLNLTSQETEIDFLGNSGGYVSVSDDKGMMKDSSGNTFGNLNTGLTFKNANPFTDYTMNAMISPLFIGRWGDYSADTDNDGNLSDENVKSAKKRLEELGFSGDLAGSVSIFYGNVFKYSPSIYANSKVYYDFVRRDTSTGNENTVLMKLTQKSSTVLDPDVSIEKPLTDATVTFAGQDAVTGDSEGYYIAEGNYEKGKTYMADVRMGAISFVGAVQGTGYKEETIDVSKYMFPTNFSVKIGGTDTGIRSNGSDSILDVVNDDTTFTFGFSSSVGVKANKAVVKILRDDREIYSKTLTRQSADQPFELTLNTLKAGVKGGDQMTIQGIFTDKKDGKEIDHVYPAVDVGMTFQNKLTAIGIAASFKTPFTKVLKLIGSVSTKFDLPLDYDVESMGNKTHYNDKKTNAQINTIQVAFGYNSKVMEELKKQQLEYRAENKGEALSGRDNIKQYMEGLMGSDDSEDDDDGDDEKATSTPAPKKDLNESKKAAEKAQESAAPASSTMGSSSFHYNFSVAVILTVESGITGQGKPDGQYYFNSLALIAAADADFQYTVSYMTPIGVEILAELEVGGKAVAAFAAESSNGRMYDDVFNVTKAGNEKGALSLNKDNFSLYTKFMLAPTITVGAGVGLGKVASVVVSGTADFDFGFTVPIMGQNESSSGYGNVTLSAALKLKILFIKKKWTLYKGEQMNLFQYGAVSVAKMLNDFEENYLYEDIDDVSNSEEFARDYLNNRSKWQPVKLKKRSVDAGKEVLLMEGAYPDQQTKMLDLGNGKQLTVFISDSGERDMINRAELFYTITKDGGTTWSRPVSVSDDGTWDEAPALYRLTDDKVLITWSDAAREFTNQDGTKDVLSQLDISGVLFDVNDNTMTDEFAITKTTQDEVMADMDPMIAFDEETQRLVVYYTKIDYDEPSYEHGNNGDVIVDEDADSASEVTTYGDIINGYNAIACRMATLKNGALEWDSADPEDPELYGQRLLDLGVPARIEETETEVPGETVEIEDENGETVTRTITETKKTSDVIVDEMIDPRVVDSDSISYNGLSLYAYTTDADANLETSDDQRLYLQIYNFRQDEFHHPIQITGDSVGDSRPKFVRCKGMTYLYWLHDGDIQYLNVSDIVSSLNSDSSYLKETQVSMPDGSTRPMYIINKYENDPVVTAIRHQQEVSEDGSVAENKISEYDVQANDNSMYVIWSALGTSQKDEDKSGAENVVRETQLYGAYCEPELESVSTAYTFEDDDTKTYQFAAGKDKTTYPVSFTALKDTTLEDGSTLSAGDVFTFDYKKQEDLNGQTGVVSAGDPAKIKTIRACDGYGWSEPVQLTDGQGDNYEDLSFRVDEDGNIRAFFIKGKQKLDDNNVFEMDESNMQMYAQTFVIGSELQNDGIQTEKELYAPGEDISFQMNVTNDGLKPIENAEYRMYIQEDNEVVTDEVEWTSLGTVTEDGGKGVLLGGNTVTLQYDGVLNMGQIEGTKLVTELKQGDEITTVEKVLHEQPELSISVVSAELVDAKTASVKLHVVNTGNQDFEGTVKVKDKEEVLAQEKNVKAAYGESCDLTMTVDISNSKFGEVTTAEDGSKSDALTLTAEYGDISQPFYVTREVSAWEGKAVDALSGVRIGQCELSNEAAQDQGIPDIMDTAQTLQPVKDTLKVSEDQVLKLEPVFDWKDDSSEAAELQKQGLDPKAILNTKWTSSDESVAYVNDNGVLIPLREGETEITAVTYPGGEMQQADPFAANGNIEEEYDGSFGSLSQTDGTGWFRQNREMYRVPESLITRNTIKVTVKKAEVKPTPTPTVTPVPTDTPSSTAPTGSQPTAAPSGTPSVSASPAASPAPSDAGVQPTVKKTMAKVTINKKGNKVTVQTLSKAKVSVNVYRNKKTAGKGKKTGLIRKYPVYQTNKKGKVVIRLKKKLKKKQAVRVTVTKKGYSGKTVVKVKK